MIEHYVSHAHLMVYTKYAMDKNDPNRFWDWVNEHIRNHLNQNVDNKNTMMYIYHLYNPAMM